MADCFFPNIMPDFVAEATAETQDEEGKEPVVVTQDCLMKLLSMPYSSLSQRFKCTTLDLKETITLETWGMSGQQVQDFTLYYGTLGTVFSSLELTYSLVTTMILLSPLRLLRLVTPLLLIQACSPELGCFMDVTFLCGRASACALGAMLAKHAVQFREIKLPKNLPDELLYGRVGYLWACLFINKHRGTGTIPSTYTCSIVNEIIKNGRELAKSGRCPLMFMMRWKSSVVESEMRKTGVKRRDENEIVVEMAI
ncbi:lanc-like protein gcl2 [Quercus suber]|uniref:Lanc-like protein gcl2 n=1 Tax=Quercus suber TaxID=58331 RepID=A0AAW0K4H8_QUESU